MVRGLLQQGVFGVWDKPQLVGGEVCLKALLEGTQSGASQAVA